MPNITAVEPQKSSKGRSAFGRNNQRRFNIFLDGVFGFGADEDTIVKFRLITGKLITAVDLEQILFETEVGKLMPRIYNLLSFRQRSEKEIRDYFRNLNFKRKRSNADSTDKEQQQISEVVIDSLIQNLKNKGLLNDLEFAKLWVDSRLKSKNLGQRALQVELYKKGIDREIITEVLENLEVDDQAIAEQALERKARTFLKLDELEFKKRATGFLQRKGFDYTTVKKVIEKFLKKE